jgi:hypothetical protein
MARNFQSLTAAADGLSKVRRLRTETGNSLSGETGGSGAPCGTGAVMSNSSCYFRMPNPSMSFRYRVLSLVFR